MFLKCIFRSSEIKLKNKLKNVFIFVEKVIVKWLFKGMAYILSSLTKNIKAK